jgi:hypothetical protein
LGSPLNHIRLVLAAAMLRRILKVLHPLPEAHPCIHILDILSEEWYLVARLTHERVKTICARLLVILPSMSLLKHEINGILAMFEVVVRCNLNIYTSNILRMATAHLILLQTLDILHHHEPLIPLSAKATPIPEAWKVHREDILNNHHHRMMYERDMEETGTMKICRDVCNNGVNVARLSHC